MLEHIKKPKLMIYLESSVDHAISQIKKRSREYELIVPREYWESLNLHYRNYFDSYNLSDILKINVDGLDFSNNENDRNYILNLIDQKINSLI